MVQLLEECSVTRHGEDLDKAMLQHAVMRFKPIVVTVNFSGMCDWTTVKTNTSYQVDRAKAAAATGNMEKYLVTAMESSIMTVYKCKLQVRCA